MSKLETYQLTHPELLSKVDLCDVLKNCCIEKLNFDAMTKAELIEIYKKIALPLPQRGCNSNDNLRGEINILFKSSNNDNSNKNNKRSLHVHPLGTNVKKVLLNGQPDRLKPPIDPSKSIEKTLKLSTVQSFHTCDNTHKRKHDERNKETVFPEVRKRQKITWP